MKLFTAVIVVFTNKARVFATANHFNPGLIYAGKANSLQLE
jgi:hypothetical protein